MKERLYETEKKRCLRKEALWEVGEGFCFQGITALQTSATWPAFSSFMSTISGNVLLFSSS